MIDYAVWFLLLSAAGLGVQTLIWAGVAAWHFDFAALDGERWRELYRYFLSGGAIRFDFVVTLAVALCLALASELLLLMRLPSLTAWLPLLPRPRLRLPRVTFAPAWRQLPLRLPALPRKRALPPSEAAPKPQPPPPVREVAPPPRDPPVDPSAANEDGAAITRLMALLEVWGDPPAGWMRDSLREEAAKISDDGWPLLHLLGPSALGLLALLESEALLPATRLAALRDVIAAAMSEPVDRTHSADPPGLTTGAAWLCELLDHFGPTDGAPIEDMLGRALRSMTDADWASLDRFPERAGRVRVQSDRLSERLRQTASAMAPALAPVPLLSSAAPSALAPVPLLSSAAPPALPPVPLLSPAALIEDMLTEFGFSQTRSRPVGADPGLLIAERSDIMVVLQPVNLRRGQWRLPQGCLGPWIEGDGKTDLPLARDLSRPLWRQLSLLRLRPQCQVRLLGLFVAHDGHFIDEVELAQLISSQRGRDTDVSLAWLDRQQGPLPNMRSSLSSLTAPRLAARQPGSAARRVAAPS